MYSIPPYNSIFPFYCHKCPVLSSTNGDEAATLVEHALLPVGGGRSKKCK